MCQTVFAGLLPELKAKVAGSEGDLDKLLTKARFKEAKLRDLPPQSNQKPALTPSANVKQGEQKQATPNTQQSSLSEPVSIVDPSDTWLISALSALSVLSVDGQNQSNLVPGISPTDDGTTMWLPFFLRKKSVNSRESDGFEAPVTKMDVLPLPRVDDSLDLLSKSWYFTVVRILAGEDGSCLSGKDRFQHIFWIV